MNLATVSTATKTKKRESQPLNMPHYNVARAAGEGRGSRINPQITAETAFLLAFQGRRQAKAVVSQLEGLLHRKPSARPEMAAGAVAFLIGADLTSGTEPTQATAQTILRRLAGALEGTGALVVGALLSEPEIDQIREFRHQLRRLLPAPPTPCGNKGPATSMTPQPKELQRWRDTNG